jgi:hypothetical protein
MTMTEISRITPKEDESKSAEDETTAPKNIIQDDQDATTAPTGSNKNNNNKNTGSEREYGGDNEDLMYRSGIPTLRSSAHRVKFSPRGRKHDPNPKDRDGKETKTTWLPPPLLVEDVFQFDTAQYDLRGAVASMLRGCDPEIVGKFREESVDATRLEDFCIPILSVWRSVNGGHCEDTQKYLSDKVASDEALLEVFDRFVQEVALPRLRTRLVNAGAIAGSDQLTTFYYQRPPTIRIQPGPAWAKVKPHNDAEYGHQNGEQNYWMPLTDRTQTGVDLWCESSFKADDYHPIPANFGEAISFHGSSCRHYVDTNSTECTRVSLDFRVGVQGFFDPSWQMKGTVHDHGRKEFIL